MKIRLVPFGSYKVGESRDQDFVAFPSVGLPEVLLREAVEVETYSGIWNLDKLTSAAQSAGIVNPDIWIFDQEGDMKPIIVANLVKDYPDAAEYIQQAMGMSVNIHGGDAALGEALDVNVRRWNDAPPHLPNLRKRVFSRIQRDAYAHGLGFFNTKSEIAGAAETLRNVPAHYTKAFLSGEQQTDPDEPPIRELLKSGEQIPTYKSQHGCLQELPELAEWRANRTYLTPVGEEGGKVFILLEEVYTYRSTHGVVELEREVWNMLLSIDLREVDDVDLSNRR